MIGDLGQRLSGLRLRHALFALLLGSLFAATPGFAAAEPPHPVGFKQIEFTDRDRQIALAVFYPATLSDNAAAPTGLPFYTNLHLYQDAELAEGRHPLVMLSHGRGSNPLAYAWFAETLASQGYIVAGLYHIAPTPTTRPSLTSPTRSASGRATSRSPSTFC
jgi:predicted dienelactone hydrolase